jgi:hypothetical protein
VVTTYDAWRTATPRENQHAGTITQKCECECHVREAWAASIRADGAVNGVYVVGIHVAPCEDGCLPADSNEPLVMNHFICIGGTMFMLYDRREP